MRTHNIKDIPIMPPDLALSLTLISSNYPCLEHNFMAPKVFEPLKFYCTSPLFQSRHRDSIIAGETQFMELRVLLSYLIPTMLRGFKTFFILNSAEHEILNARKDKDIKKFGIFRLR